LAKLNVRFVSKLVVTIKGRIQDYEQAPPTARLCL